MFRAKFFSISEIGAKIPGFGTFEKIIYTKNVILVLNNIDISSCWNKTEMLLQN